MAFDMQLDVFRNGLKQRLLAERAKNPDISDDELRQVASQAWQGIQERTKGAGPWAEGYVGAKDYEPSPEKKMNDFGVKNLAGIPWEAQARMFNRPEDVEAMRENQASIVTNFVGGGAGGALAGKVLAPIAKGVIGRIAASGLTGAASGAAGGASDAAVQGRDVADEAKSGAVLGGALGVGGRVLGEGISAGQKLVRKIPWVGDYLAAKDAGTYARPDMARLPGNEAGVQQVVDRAQTTMTARNAEKLGQAGTAYAAEAGAAKAAIPEQSSQAAVDKLYELSASNRSVRSGKIRDADLEKAINETFERLDIGPDGNVHIDDLLAARRRIGDLAEFNSPATKDNRPFREIYKSLNDTIENPGLRAADAKFSGQKAESERFTDVLTGTEEGNISRGVRADGTPDVRAAKERTAAARLKRLGDSTVAGTTEARQLEEIRNMDPAYAEQMALVEAQKAKAATAFGAPQVQSSLPRLIGKLPGAPLVEQNARWLGARVAGPLLDAAGNVVESIAEPMVTNPVVRGAIQDRERQRRLSDRVKSGGKRRP